MRTSTHRSRGVDFDDGYFERKSRDLIVADDEIEAWELDGQDLGDLLDTADDFSLQKFD
jgi:hypothetical protein